MKRCVSLDEISHFVGMILYNVVYGVLNQPSLDVSAATCVETFCDLWNQLRERGTVPSTQVQRHVILSALCRIELRVGGKRPIHFKHCVKLRLASVSIHKMFHLTRSELAKVKEVAEVIRLPPNDQFLGESRNLHKAHVPQLGSP